MNNNMQPNFYPDANSNPFFQQGMDINGQIRSLENRVYNLEKEVMNLRNKINRLGNNQTPYQDNYTSNYNPNSYNMM